MCPSPDELVPNVPADAVGRNGFQSGPLPGGESPEAAVFVLLRRRRRLCCADVPRILHTLETGTIISTRAAAGYLGARFPEWGPLLSDVRGRFFPSYSSPPLRARLARALAATRFVQAMIGHANRQHGLGHDRESHAG
jgi:hypothetical protein